MREILAEEITRSVKEMCIEVNYHLGPDMEKSLDDAYVAEEAELGKKVLGQLRENREIAAKEWIPMCQDTGMTVVFLEIGQEVHVVGGSLSDAVNKGIRLGYEEGFLRKSVVGDPLIRKNTGDNTPGVIHYEIVPGETFQISVAPKGFGSENMSQLFMLKPSDGVEGVKQAVLKAVKDAGPNACPPLVIGVGIGGTFEKSALLAKKALLRELGDFGKTDLSGFEQELLDEINGLGIGPGGLGGKTTALAVFVETYPTHIAGLPVAVNICCHMNRHGTREL